MNETTQATITALISSLNPSSFGQPVTLTATVTSPPFFNMLAPTGTATFYDGAAIVATSSLDSSGRATLTTSNLSVGTHSITVTYNGDSNFAPSTSPVLSQIVQGAVVLISPTSLSFGNQTVNITSTAQTVALTNTGNIALTESIAITGTNAGDFAQTNNCGSSVPAGGSCTISVKFDPTAAGARSASLTFTDNAPNSPQSASLTGVGVTPSVTLSPPSLTFSTQVVFTSSKAQSVTLTNTAMGILKIMGGGITGPFGVTTTCGKQVNPGASCTINVTFKPTTIGTLTGAVSIRDNATGSPQKIPLSGTGTYIQPSPTSVNFGNQPVGTTSLQKKVTVSNKGSVTVSISGITITGTNAGDFAEVNNCGTSLPGGASCFIGVTFTPSTTGSRTASVSISDNGGGSPQQVPLAGTGTP